MRNNIEIYKTLINSLDISMFVIDKYGKTILANDATLELYGCTWEDFETNYSNTQYLLDNDIVDKCALLQIFQKKKPVSETYTIMNAEGNRETYYTQKMPVFNENNEVEYVVGWSKKLETIEFEYKSAIRTLSAPLANKLIEVDENNKFIHESPEMSKILMLLDNVVKTDATVLLQGETGTGKEVLAQYIHDNSIRNRRKIVVVNCAAIPPNLFESELFGYTKGSFTGASAKGQTGQIELADKSTLFLDEIDSIPLEMQSKLLRTLESKEVKPVGSTSVKKIDFRLVAATNKNLYQLVKEGKFRSDLYFRLNVIAVTIPPLRKRVKDIHPLTDYYLQRYCKLYGLHKQFSPSIYRQLEEYRWPGNVRELKNLIERVILTSNVDDVFLQSLPLGYFAEEQSFGNSNKSILSENFSEEADDVSFFAGNSGEEFVDIMEGDKNEPLDKMIEIYESSIIKKTLENSSSVVEAAHKLGVSLSTLERRIRKYQLRS